MREQRYDGKSGSSSGGGGGVGDTGGLTRM